MNIKRFNRLVEISRAMKPNDFAMRCFHTTFILFKNKIVSIGINSPKTHPQSLNFNYKSSDGTDIRKHVGLHSELAAILKYGKEDLSNHVFVNVRIDRNNNLKISKPCFGCHSVLQQFGFKKIYFTNNLGEFENYAR